VPAYTARVENRKQNGDRRSVQAVHLNAEYRGHRSTRRRHQHVDLNTKHKRQNSSV